MLGPLGPTHGAFDIDLKEPTYGQANCRCRCRVTPPRCGCNLLQPLLLPQLPDVPVVRLGECEVKDDNVLPWKDHNVLPLRMCLRMCILHAIMHILCTFCVILPIF